MLTTVEESNDIDADSAVLRFTAPANCSVDGDLNESGYIFSLETGHISPLSAM